MLAWIMAAALVLGGAYDVVDTDIDIGDGKRPRAARERCAGDETAAQLLLRRPAGPAAAVAEAHEFCGRHLLASYTGCDPRALRDLTGLRNAMRAAVQQSGATWLEAVEHVFPPDGITMVVLLSESHASIHTYPEYDSCFIDLFTCGRTCQVERFDQVLRVYLRPVGVQARVFSRDQAIHPDTTGA